MSRAQHTPGPWEVVEHTVPGATGLRQLYITAPDPDSHPESGHRSVPVHMKIAYTGATDRNRADAALAAAAPELLAACEAADQTLEAAGFTAMGAARQLIRDAMSNARGGSR